MARALMEVVAATAVQTAADVQRYVRCTLLCAMQPFEEVWAQQTVALCTGAFANVTVVIRQ